MLNAVERRLVDVAVSSLIVGSFTLSQDLEDCTLEQDVGSSSSQTISPTASLTTKGVVQLLRVDFVDLSSSSSIALILLDLCSADDFTLGGIVQDLTLADVVDCCSSSTNDDFVATDLTLVEFADVARWPSDDDS